VANPSKKLPVATKVPPATFRWPVRLEDRPEEVFPPDHIRRYTERSLANLGVETIRRMSWRPWRAG